MIKGRICSIISGDIYLIKKVCTQNMRYISAFLAFVLFFCFAAVPLTAVCAVPSVPETGMAYVVMDADTGYVICSSDNCRDRFYPASLTKIVTAMVALDNNTDLTTSMTVSQTAIDGIGADGQRTGFLNAGSVIDYGSLMKIMMVWSANETAYAIAENISGSVGQFVEAMNAKAAALGLTGTHFVNPCGMHNNDHYTTAMDMAVLARETLKYPVIREMGAMQTVDVSYDGTRYTFSSTNRLVYPAHFGLTYDTTFTKGEENHSFTVTGLKTGYTDPAGCCLITTSNSTDGRSLISVVLKASSAALAADYSHKLISYVYKNAEFYDVCSAGQTCCTVNVTGSPLSQAELVYADSLRISALPEMFDPSRVTSRAVVPDVLAAPIATDSECGKAEFTYGDTVSSFAFVSLKTSAEIPSATPVPTPPPLTTAVPSDENDGGRIWQFAAISLIGSAVFICGAVMIARLKR